MDSAPLIVLGGYDNIYRHHSLPTSIHSDMDSDLSPCYSPYLLGDDDDDTKLTTGFLDQEEIAVKTPGFCGQGMHLMIVI